MYVTSPLALLQSCLLTQQPHPHLVFHHAPPKCANIVTTRHVTTDNPLPDKLDNPHPHLVSPLHPRNSFAHCPKPPSPRQTVIGTSSTTEHVNSPSLHASIAPIPYCIAETMRLRFEALRRIYNCYTACTYTFCHITYYFFPTWCLMEIKWMVKWSNGIVLLKQSIWLYTDRGWSMAFYDICTEACQSG